MSVEKIKDRPGEKALQAFKLLANDAPVFKIPAIRNTKKQPLKAKVLDEDTYIEEMAKIIQRDFFPDLEKLKAQNEFLDATERKDHQKLRELFIKYSSGNRPLTEKCYGDASPATFETPHSGAPCTPSGPPPNVEDVLGTTPKLRDAKQHSQAIERDKVKLKVSSKHSLDSYLAAYTSEDNSSFEDLMEEMGRRSRAKFAGQLEEERESQLKMLTATDLPSIEEQANDIDKPKNVETWSYKAKNYIMYVPDGQPVTQDLAKERQEVVHGNTRMEKDPFDYQRSKETISQIAKSQERILSGRIGVDGSTLLDEKGRSSEGGGLGSGHQEISAAGTRLLPLAAPHSFVRTPSPCPGAPGESPIMTWGEIEGSPFRLDGGDTPLPGKAAGASFKMALVPKREQLAMALAEKAGQRHRAMKQKAMDAAKRSMLSPSPRMATGSTAERLASMSPAAQRLATTHLKRHLTGITTPQSRLTPRTGSTSSRSFTPLVANWNASNSKTTTPKSTRRKTATPLVVSGGTEDKRLKDNITDDLLQITVPKRQRLTAADFFT